MKKKILTALSICCVTLGIIGCGTEEEKSKSSMFVVVELEDSWKVVYHKDTKVMYAVSDSGYNRGTFTLLVDEECKPMLWNEN